MKKVCLLALTMLLMLYLTASAAQPLPGDANLDTRVDVQDLVVMINSLVNGVPCASPDNADVNGNGAVDIQDLMLVVRIILGGGVPGEISTKEDFTDSEIPFTTETVEDPERYVDDEDQVLVEGKSGVKRTYFKVTLHDGVEVSREQIREEVVTAMVPQKVSRGTKQHVTETKTETVVEVIPYETFRVASEGLPIGTEKVEEGSNGEKKVTYTVTYVDGAEKSRAVTKEETIKEPKHCYIYYGTRDAEFTTEYEYVQLSGGGVAGPHSSYYENKAKAHAMAMAKAGKVFHSGGSESYIESVGGFVSREDIETRLVNHAGGFRDPNVHYGYGCVRARNVASDSGATAWYYFACLQGSSNPPE